MLNATLEKDGKKTTIFFFGGIRTPSTEKRARNKEILARPHKNSASRWYSYDRLIFRYPGSLQLSGYNLSDPGIEVAEQ